MRRFFTQKAGVLLTLLTTTFGLTNAQAQITFTNQGGLLQNIGGTSYADCAADMNGDGLDDVVRVMSNGIYIDYQQANGTFNPMFYPLSIQNLPSWSICAGDIDGNGYMDLLLGAGDRVSFVYASNDGASFVEDAHPEYIFTQRSTFADIDNDGDLDAFANHDVDQCHPYRNVDGVLDLDFSLIQTLDVGGNYAAIWVDYDNDWDTDLYITKCRGGASWGDPQRINLLYRNNGDGTYTEAAADANLNDGNQSWTTTFEDFDNDGDFDAFTVNHSSGDVPGGAANKFWRNNGDGTFTDIIATTGINAGDLNAWNCDAGDFDNNGFVDIFSEMSTEMYWNSGNNTFTGGQLTGFNSGGIGDFNNDGFLDVISGNSLMLNDGNNNNWVKFDLEGIISNKSAVGARVEIYGSWGVQIREVRSGESFDPASSLITHFGLGQATSIDQVVVKWPSGTITSIDNPAINQQHTILEAGCIGPNITITAGGATTICPGGSVTLSAPNAASYTWNNGQTSQSIEVTGAGNYSVVAWSDEECASLSNIIVVDVIEENAPSINVSGDLLFCEGSSTVLTSSVANNYTWSNGQTSQSIVVSASGEYHVSIEGLCDGVTYDSETISVQVMDAVEPVVADVIIGEPGTATFTASGGTNFQWFDSANGTTPVGSGESFTTPSFDNAVTYWVSSETVYGGGQESGGKLDISGGGSLPSSGGRLFFNATENFTLEQVTVHVPAEGIEGNRTIELYNNGGVLINSAVVYCVFGDNLIDLNFDIEEGTGYQIGCAENNLYRNNSSLTYPYAIGTVGSIYDSSFGTGYYYYFYNWQVRKESWSCTSERVEVSAMVIGVNETENPLNASVYPNPADDNLSLTCAENGNIQVQITDMTGRVVMTTQVNFNSARTANLNISELSAGVYHLTASNGTLQSTLDFVKK
jgi:hypothetical protein